MRQRTSTFAVLCLLLLFFGSVAAAEKVSIALYDVRMQDLDMASIERFKAANRGVEVEVVWTPDSYFEKMMTMFAAGVMPDIINRDVGHRDAAEFQHRGCVIDLHRYYVANQEHFRDWLPGIIDGAYSRGALPAIPRPSLQTYVLYYNLDHFGAVGLPFADGSWDWEGFRRAGKRLTGDLNGDGTIDVFAYDESWNHWQPVLRNNGVLPVTPDLKATLLGSPEAQQALEYLRDLRFVDRVMPTAADKWGNSRRAYTAGKLSMILGPSLVASTMEAVPSGVSLEPFAPGKKTRYTMMTIQSFSVSSQCKNPALAFELIKYLTDEETARQTLIETGSMVAQSKLNRSHFGQGVNIKDFKAVFEASVAQPIFYAYAGVLDEPWELIKTMVEESTAKNEQALASIAANFVPRINAALLAQW